MKNRAFFPAVVLLLNILWICGFLIVIINRTYPLLGHDYTYVTSRLLDTHLHYLVNGLSIQWYTPSFGGGLPAYANPQQIQFSLIQFLTFFLGPWTAINIAIIIYTSIGFICFYLLSTKLLGMDWRASLLGSVFLTVTGFYIGRMITGQLGFMTFPLISTIIFILLSRKWSDLIAGVALALIVSSLIYQDGFYMIVAFILSCAITLPILYIINPELIPLKATGFRLLIAACFILLISSSKLYAVYTFMRYFPREYIDQYSPNVFGPIGSLVAQMLGTMTLAPMLAITGTDPNSLPNMLTIISGSVYSLWETDNGISPVLIGVFFVSAINYLLSRKRFSFKTWTKNKFIALAIVMGFTWFTLEFILAKGILFPLVQKLPIIKSLHINFRFISALFLPLSLLGTLILDKWFRANINKKANFVFAALNILALLSPLSYYLYTQDVHRRIFDVTNVLQVYQLSRQGETFPITHVANTTDWNSFIENATTIRPYEPIFGYFLEEFKPEIHVGEIFDITDGYFNLTNPASLNFPDQNGGRLFSRFKESERETVTRFTQRYQLDWRLPLMQTALNAISLLSLFISLAIVIYGITRRNSNKL